MKIKFGFSKAHFRKDLHPSHGPQSWPWWRHLSFKFCNLNVCSPSTGYRLWFYTRWGAGYVEMFIIRGRG